MNSKQYIVVAKQINSNAIYNIFLSHENSRWAEALLPLSPLHQASLSGRIYSEGTGFGNRSLAMKVSG